MRLYVHQRHTIAFVMIDYLDIRYNLWLKVRSEILADEDRWDGDEIRRAPAKRRDMTIGLFNNFDTKSLEKSSFNLINS